MFAERGYAETTAAAVAERAGLTERTFFRYFADKKEVLFGNDEQLREVVQAAADEADGPPLAVVRAGLLALAAELQPSHELQRLRARIIAGNPELAERELAKAASWADTAAERLRARGVAASEAALAAEIGLAVFRVAHHRWIDSPEDADLAELISSSFDQIPGLVQRG